MNDITRPITDKLSPFEIASEQNLDLKEVIAKKDAEIEINKEVNRSLANRNDDLNNALKIANEEKEVSEGLIMAICKDFPIVKAEIAKLMKEK